MLAYSITIHSSYIITPKIIAIQQIDTSIFNSPINYKTTLVCAVVNFSQGSSIIPPIRTRCEE